MAPAWRRRGPATSIDRLELPPSIGARLPRPARTAVDLAPGISYRFPVPDGAEERFETFSAQALALPAVRRQRRELSASPVPR